MKFHNNELVEAVRRERINGSSLKNIQQRFGISNTVISRWTHDITVESAMVARARTFETLWKNKLQQIGRKRLNREVSILCLAVMYWCEGAKYPATNFVAFSNSNPALILSFLQLLRKTFKVDETKFRIHIQLHSTHIVEKEFRYWQRLLHIPRNRFYTPTITTPGNKRKRTSYHGTCTIKYYDVRVLLTLSGIFETFSERFWKGG